MLHSISFPMFAFENNEILIEDFSWYPAVCSSHLTVLFFWKLAAHSDRYLGSCILWVAQKIRVWFCRSLFERFFFLFLPEFLCDKNVFNRFLKSSACYSTLHIPSVFVTLEVARREPIINTRRKSDRSVVLKKYN